MTPAARIQSAIEILDRVLTGAAAEQALTAWARASRYAGSKDRAGVRDHVYDALRCRRSFTAMSGGGAPTGRRLMIGALRAGGVDPETVFGAPGYAPAGLDDGERNGLRTAPAYAGLAGADALDFPDWLETALRDSLGPAFTPVLQAMRSRAPVIVRVHSGRTTVADMRASLAGEGFTSQPHLLAQNALEITENARKISLSRAYGEGLIELQDAAPQAAVEALPLQAGMRVLDYCAGGGGKVLAMAARVPGQFFAHDATPSRMRDLPERAHRAKAQVTVTTGSALARAAPFDLVLADVPCSGSGTWRRAPEAKWALTPERLSELLSIQAGILDTATGLVKNGGWLCYMTCSLLSSENADQVAAFLQRHPGWRLVKEQRFTPMDGGDGFFSALLVRVSA